MMNKCLFFFNDYNISKELCMDCKKCVLHRCDIYVRTVLSPPVSSVCSSATDAHNILPWCRPSNTDVTWNEIKTNITGMESLLPWI